MDPLSIYSLALPRSFSWCCPFVNSCSGCPVNVFFSKIPSFCCVVYADDSLTRERSEKQQTIYCKLMQMHTQHVSPQPTNTHLRRILVLLEVSSSLSRLCLPTLLTPLRSIWIVSLFCTCVSAFPTCITYHSLYPTSTVLHALALEGWI